MPCHLQTFWVQDNVHLSASDAQEHAELDKGKLPFPLGGNDFFAKAYSVT